jgi:hypothetical protein
MTALTPGAGVIAALAALGLIWLGVLTVRGIRKTLARPRDLISVCGWCWHDNPDAGCTCTEECPWPGCPGGHTTSWDAESWRELDRLLGKEEGSA